MSLRRRKVTNTLTGYIFENVDTVERQVRIITIPYDTEQEAGSFGELTNSPGVFDNPANAIGQALRSQNQDLAHILTAVGEMKLRVDTMEAALTDSSMIELREELRKKRYSGELRDLQPTEAAMPMDTAPRERPAGESWFHEQVRAMEMQEVNSVVVTMHEGYDERITGVTQLGSQFLVTTESLDMYCDYIGELRAVQVRGHSTVYTENDGNSMRGRLQVRPGTEESESGYHRVHLGVVNCPQHDFRRRAILEAFPVCPMEPVVVLSVERRDEFAIIKTNYGVITIVHGYLGMRNFTNRVGTRCYADVNTEIGAEPVALVLFFDHGHDRPTRLEVPHIPEISDMVVSADVPYWARMHRRTEGEVDADGPANTVPLANRTRGLDLFERVTATAPRGERLRGIMVDEPGDWGAVDAEAPAMDPEVRVQTFTGQELRMENGVFNTVHVVPQREVRMGEDGLFHGVIATGGEERRTNRATDAWPALGVAAAGRGAAARAVAGTLGAGAQLGNFR